jgi:hypothetical protein
VIGKNLAEVKIFTYVDGYSTSRIIAKIAKGNVLTEGVE